jgi:hypothetical protein
VVSVGYLEDDQFTKQLPRYCRDLKQILDDQAEALASKNSLQNQILVWTNEDVADLKKS